MNPELSPKFPLSAAAKVSHLVDTSMPSVRLPSISGEMINLSSATGLCAAFVMPGPGDPSLRDGPEWLAGWRQIFSADGCDGVCNEIAKDSREIWGAPLIFVVTGQPLAHLQRVNERIGWDIPFLSDSSGELLRSLGISQFSYEGSRFHPRGVLVIRDGVITTAISGAANPVTQARELVAQLREETYSLDLSLFSSDRLIENDDPTAE